MQAKTKKNIALLLAILFLLVVSTAAYIISHTNFKEHTPEDDYQDFFNASTIDAQIPNLDQGLVPQGLGYISSLDWLVIAYYSDAGNPSSLAFVNATTSEYIKTVILNNADQTPFTGHCGGVSASEKNLWVASDSMMFRIPLSVIEKAADFDQVSFVDQFMTVSNASFSFYKNGILWSGEFYYPKDYPTDESHVIDVNGGTNHALISGYKLDKNTDLLPSGKFVDSTTPVTPDYFLSIPDRIQGADVLSDGRIILSQSYGRNNDSTLITYEDVLSKGNDNTLTINGTDVPVWYLDRVSRISRLKAPTMTEGVVQKDPGTYFVLFESGAAAYANGKYQIYNIYKVNAE